MYAFSYDAPGDPRVYGLVSDQLGIEMPEGLVVQLVTRGDDGLRHLNVWRSREEWEFFRDTKVRPAVGEVLRRLGVPEGSPPQEQELDIVDFRLLAGTAGLQPPSN